MTLEGKNCFWRSTQKEKNRVSTPKSQANMGQNRQNRHAAQVKAGYGLSPEFKLPVWPFAQAHPGCKKDEPGNQAMYALSVVSRTEILICMRLSAIANETKRPRIPSRKQDLVWLICVKCCGRMHAACRNMMVLAIVACLIVARMYAQ